MKDLFSVKDLKELATRTNAYFFQDTKDVIRIVYNVNGIHYTEMYFGSKKNGFKKHYK